MKNPKMRRWIVRLSSLAIGVLGAVSVIGGLIGFFKAGSIVSLLVGGVGGLVLLICALKINKGSRKAAVVSLVISALFAIRFLPAYLETHAVMPALVMSVLSLVGVAASALALPKQAKA